MKSFAVILERATLGAFVGGVIGWFAGIAYYFLISVPRAENMSAMYRDSFLCAEGQAPMVFAMLGIIVGIILGSRIGHGIVIARKRSESDEKTHEM